MTLTLDLTPEQEARIQTMSHAMGIEPTEFLRRMIDDLPHHPDGPRPGESVFDALNRIGVYGAVEGRPRKDGKAWSEIEGFE